MAGARPLLHRPSGDFFARAAVASSGPEASVRRCRHSAWRRARTHARGREGGAASRPPTRCLHTPQRSGLANALVRARGSCDGGHAVPSCGRGWGWRRFIPVARREHRRQRDSRSDTNRCWPGTHWNGSRQQASLTLKICTAVTAARRVWRRSQKQDLRGAVEWG